MRCEHCYQGNSIDGRSLWWCENKLKAGRRGANDMPRLSRRECHCVVALVRGDQQHGVGGLGEFDRVRRFVRAQHSVIVIIALDDNAWQAVACESIVQTRCHYLPLGRGHDGRPELGGKLQQSVVNLPKLRAKVQP